MGISRPALLLAALAFAMPVPGQAPPAAPPPTSLPPTRPPEQILFEVASQAMRAGKLADAEKLFRRALALNPKMASAWANLGLIQANAGRTSEAISSFQKAVAQEPEIPAFLMPLAQLQLKARRFEEAEKTARRVLKLTPQSEPALSVLSDALLGRGSFAEAAAALVLLNAARGGKDRSTLMRIVAAYSNAGRRRDAREWARRLAARFPQDKAAPLLVGDLSAQLAIESGARADWLEAKGAYARAFALDAKNVRAALTAARCAEQAGDATGAGALYRQIIARYPGTAVGHLAQGMLHLERKDYAAAQTSLEAALVADPGAGGNPAFLVPLADALAHREPPEDARALRYYRQAAAVDPGDERAWRGAARLEERAGRLTEAAICWRSLLAARPGDALAHERLVALLLRLGKRESAIAALEAWARARAGDAEPLRRLGALQMESGKLPEARAAYERALSRAPESIGLHLSLARLEEKAGQRGAARRRYDQAFSLSPGNAALRQEFIGFLERAGKSAEALAAREKWVSDAPESAAARWELAQHYIRLGRDDDALLHLGQITPERKDPMHGTYRLGAASLLKERGRLLEELAERQRLLSTEPEGPLREKMKKELADAWWRQGKEHQRAGRVEQAKMAFDEALKLDPSSPAGESKKELGGEPPNI